MTFSNALCAVLSHAPANFTRISDIPSYKMVVCMWRASMARQGVVLICEQRRQSFLSLRTGGSFFQAIVASLCDQPAISHPVDSTAI